jgi:glycosyltransferase involved in cell wall biosynthesis
MKKCSVIIPTYNGAEKILNLIRALQLQTVSDFETIIVVDGSTDNTIRLLEENKFLVQNLNVIVQENKGRAGARNAGASNARSELLIFFDDDIEPSPDCIEQHILHHSKIADTVMFGKLLMDNRKANNDFYQYRYSNEVRWIEPFGKMSREITFEQFTITTQNLSMSKKIFDLLHGFDERLNDSEDFDLGVRALLKNVPVYFNPNAFAWHRDFVDISKYMRRQMEYYRGKKSLLNIHPEYLQLLPKHFSFLQPKSLTKRLLAGLFHYNILWRNFIHSGLFRNTFSEKLRFRVYEILIFSNSVL